MRHTINKTGTDFSYLAVLLLLAYVLTSGPRFVKQFKENKEDIKIEKVSPLREVLKMGKYYGVDPYLKVLNRLMPGDDNTEPQPATLNLATMQTPDSR